MRTRLAGIGIQEFDAVFTFEAGFDSGAVAKSSCGVGEQLWSLVEHTERADGHELALHWRELWSAQDPAVGTPDDEIGKVGIEITDLLEEPVGMIPIDALEVLGAVGQRVRAVEHLALLGRRAELVSDREQGCDGSREAGIGHALEAAFPQRGLGESPAERLGREAAESIEIEAREGSGQADQGSVVVGEMLSFVEGAQKQWVRHAQSIVALLLLVLVLPACTGKVRRFDDASVRTLSRSYGMDPIPLPEGGSVPRAKFQAHVARMLASNWMSYLAMDKALAAEIEDRGLEPPDLASRTRMRGLVRYGFLREWLPASQGSYRAEKAELDLAQTLSNLLVVTGEKNLDKAALKRCFIREIRRRAPRLHKEGDEILATCQGQEVHVLEVYPELSALMPASKRNELLYELSPKR